MVMSLLEYVVWLQLLVYVLAYIHSSFNPYPPFNSVKDIVCQRSRPIYIQAFSSSYSSAPSIPSSSSSQNWEYDVFPSFHGKDVRKAFLSHVLKEFGRKAINFFVDNEIKRGEFIGPELKRAIKGSKIALVLLSKNYASSSWCLDELAEIMKQESGQTVITIFYEVDPTDVKKQKGDFGKVFKKTCKGKDKEKIKTWRKALEDVATIAGYHSSNWFVFLI
ncbi:probable disease resistance protein RPP1 [Arabidopsis lyrata subsp. lyrata]|uniref:probable disease resistance protein RPP1 n=1 Tax=Arabidopsis lyrata subsp. lyrata TaxID=81972 RepID=UPI000A29C51F|nr:probable disease resistance protein RPP1 [Arabidopsis lyrata subsp. lyrata]|eukprot:XP_020868736.1 probable disease resistance protein RPP1 [Arabidopsis lyrata subsp. lyrata]